MHLSFKGWIVPVLVLGTMAYCVAEEITLTTYYPSPRGVYSELRTSGNVQIGTVDAPADATTAPRLHIVLRKDTDPATTAPALLVEDQVDTSLASPRDQSPFIIDASGNVGIGTAVLPVPEKLVVAGNVSISGSGNGLLFPDGSVQNTATRMVQDATVTDSVRHDTTTGRTGDRGVPGLSINKQLSSSKIIVQWSLTTGVYNNNVQIMWRTGSTSGPIVYVTGVAREDTAANVWESCSTRSGVFVDATPGTGPRSYYFTYGRGAGVDDALRLLINCNGSDNTQYQQSSSSFLLMEVLE